MNNYDWDEYLESSEVDELFKEFQERCMDIIYSNVNSELNEIITRNAILTGENIKLKEQNDSLKEKAAETTKSLNDSDMLLKMLKYLKNSHNDEKIYTLFNLMFEKDFEENLYEAPLWLGILTQYYSHKDEAIEFLKLLGVDLPNNVENFRLPIDWTEEELDIFFDTIPNHINCNNCAYEANLRFWDRNSLLSVNEQCRKMHHYSEIPWQYVLRNPLLKKEKYLKQIGSHMLDAYSNWSKFSMIDKYLTLEPQELKIILDNIKYQLLTTNKGNALNFICRHLNLIENEHFLNQIYDLCHNSYDFTYKYKVLDMPFKYVKKWCCEHTDYAINLLKENKNKFTDEQRKELLAVIFR